MEYRYRNEDELKDSGIEWLGKIPKNWEVIRNKYLLSEINLKNNGNNENLLSVSEYYGVALRRDKISEDEFLTRAESLEGYKICKKDDLVMNIMLAWKKAMGVSNYDGIVSPAYCIYRKKHNIFMKYYHYLFRTDLYANVFKQNSTGIIDSRLRLYPDKFLSLYSHMPSILVQEKIANFLDKKTSQFDLIISKKEELIQKLEEAKKSLISEVVTGKVKVVKTDDGYELAKRKRDEMKDSGVEWLGDIPKEWDVNKFKYLLSKIGSGKTPKGGAEVYQDEGVIFIRSQNVHNTGLRLDEVVYISHEADDEMKNSRIQKNDVLLNITGASIGRTSIFEYDNLEANVNQHVCILRPNVNYILPTLLNKIVQSGYIQEQIQSMQTGSSREGLNFEQIGNMSLVIDKDIKIQESIDECLDKKINNMNAIINKTKLQIEKLKEAKQSLISEAVTGKIEILD